MTQSDSPAPTPSRTLYPYGGQQGSSANLADILERVLDKGIVIVGDIKINLLDIELLTIKLRLLVASVDKAKEIGIDWWENDPALSSRADGRHSLKEQNERLRAEVEELRRRVAESPPELSGDRSGDRRRSHDAEREPRTEPRTEARTEPRTEARTERSTERRAERRAEPHSEPRAEPRRKRRKTEDDEDRGRRP
ncbi:gas vesicle synthesis protein [Streptomyces dysideae]|uniref:Gas vesicle synthesis protein n=1 Tax=Streptomyces dysideae TaxID=909626 RepID=A0A101V224_9ACTN|nr:gas vesicle protein [Streptomyces dysideae]KUO21027.1 gas vesicle synthesis protein [Streptomyces dysideae]